MPADHRGGDLRLVASPLAAAAKCIAAAAVAATTLAAEPPPLAAATLALATARLYSLHIIGMRSTCLVRSNVYDELPRHLYRRMRRV